MPRLLQALPLWLIAVMVLPRAGAAAVIEPLPERRQQLSCTPPEEVTQLHPRAATVTAVLIVTLLGLAQPMGSDGEAHWEGDHLIGRQDF